MNIVFFGSSQFVIPIIKVLKDKFNLSLVITTEKSDGAVPLFCKQNKIPFVSVNSLKENKDIILKNKAEVAVVADFGLIIPEEILNAFPKGIINVHPSLLPKYRGPTPVQTAILQDDKITGVSIIKLDKEIDHGPILGQIQERILNTDTAETLYERLFTIGANLLLKTIGLYLIEKLNLIAQNHKKATFTKPLTRQDGYIDIDNPPTRKRLNSMIRAYYPWPGVFTKLKMRNDELKILKLLPLGKIQLEGKKPVTYKDLLNGYPEIRERLEKQLESLI
jgi:methionyl-tRNA formyltransferase